MECENEVVSAHASPSGRARVVVFERGCGATVGFTTQISIIRSEDALSDDDVGNVLIVDDKVSLAIRWASHEELSISGWRGTRVFKQAATVEGIRIEYEDDPVD
jgi:hypothetical protein